MADKTKEHPLSALEKQEIMTKLVFQLLISDVFLTDVAKVGRVIAEIAVATDVSVHEALEALEPALAKFKGSYGDKNYQVVVDAAHNHKKGC